MDFIVRNSEYTSDCEQFVQQFESHFNAELSVSLRQVNGNYGPLLPRVHDLEFSLWLRTFWAKWGVMGPYLPSSRSESMSDPNS